MRSTLLKALTRAKGAKSTPKTTSQIVFTLLYNQHLGAVVKSGFVNPSTVDGLHYWVESFGYIIDYNVYNMLGGMVGKDGVMSVEELKSNGLIYDGQEVQVKPISNEVINFMTASSDSVIGAI